MWSFKKNYMKRSRGSGFWGSLGVLVMLALVLAACAGGATTAGSSAPAAPGQQSGGSSSSGSQGSQGGQSKNAFGPQYLVKSLQVNMLVKDTRQVANDLQSWIATTDSRSSSAGIDYQQVGDNLYNVSMTFSVQSTLYPQIESYLANYPGQHGGKLLNLHENVQDVTNDYIDTQSRLTNLRGEQQRLLTLLSNAQALGDIISIQDKLTEVEGQIEQIEAHLSALKGQVTFYTVTIGLQPMVPAAPPPPQNTWNPGQVLHDSLAAALAFGQFLATVVIWLVTFSIYLVPLALIAWFAWRRMHPRQVAAPATPAATTGSTQTGP